MLTVLAWVILSTAAAAILAAVVRWRRVVFSVDMVIAIGFVALPLGFWLAISWAVTHLFGGSNG